MPPRAPSSVRTTRRALTALALGGLCLLTGAAAWAHGPTRQKVTESVRIDAPAATVWARIQDFAGLKTWHPAVLESPADKGNEVGSVRQLKLQGGGELTETLESWDAAKMSMSYRAKNGGALPVTNYSSTLRVSEDGGQSVVEWRGAFYRGYPNNDPPPDQNDEAAVRAVTGVYQAGLARLKQLAEAR